jgi:hypothetical protein
MLDRRRFMLACLLRAASDPPRCNAMQSARPSTSTRCQPSQPGIVSVNDRKVSAPAQKRAPRPRATLQSVSPATADAPPPMSGHGPTAKFCDERGLALVGHRCSHRWTSLFARNPSRRRPRMSRLAPDGRAESFGAAGARSGSALGVRAAAIARRQLAPLLLPRAAARAAARSARPAREGCTTTAVRDQRSRR